MKRLGLSEISPAIVFGRPTIDTAWLGPVQRRAIAFVLEASRRGESAMLLGPRACGKSVVLDQVLAAAAPERFFRISDSWESPRALLTALLESVELGGADLGEIDQRNLLQTYLDADARDGTAVWFAIDDADRLPAAVWRELLRLGSMRAGGVRPFMLFVGRPETATRLEEIDASAREALEGRLHEMAPPTKVDCSAYIEHRLLVAGADTSLFPVPARLLVGKLARGSFVRVNLLAQAAMLLARQRGIPRLSEELVFEGSRTMLAPPPDRSRPGDPVPARRSGAAGSERRAERLGRLQIVPTADSR